MQLKGMDMELKKMDLQSKGTELEIKRQSMAMDQEAKASELGFKRQQMEMDLTGKRMGLEYEVMAREGDAEKAKKNYEDTSRRLQDTIKLEQIKSEQKQKQPKKVVFERGPDGRITGAVVS